jgi:uncharacterized protein (TIGR02266 family)
MRRYPRFESRERVRLQVGDRDEMRVLWTQDVSCGGLFVQTDEPPPFGSRVTVAIETPDGSISLTAEVVHVLPREVADQFGRSPGVGLQFVELSETESRAIERYVDGIAQRLTQELEAAPTDPATIIELARRILQGFEDNDLYGAVDVDPRADTDAIHRSSQALIRKLEQTPPGLTPAQLARVERATVLLRKIRALLIDPARRLAYDLRRDLVYAKERLARASAEEAEQLRATWCEIHPDRIDEAERHAAEALRCEQALDLEKALAAGSAALHCDPFNVPLRSTLERWRQVLSAREAAPPAEPSAPH